MAGKTEKALSPKHKRFISIVDDISDTLYDGSVAMPSREALKFNPDLSGDMQSVIEDLHTIIKDLSCYKDKLLKLKTKL